MDQLSRAQGLPFNAVCILYVWLLIILPRGEQEMAVGPLLAVPSLPLRKPGNEFLPGPRIVVLALLLNDAVWTGLPLPATRKAPAS